MSLQDFEILQELGKGAYGSVFKVKRKEDQEIYALKKVIVTKLNDREKENSINEIRILASLNHPNVISYKEAFYDASSSSICTIMEFADDGDLEIKINEKIKSRSHFSENDIWNILYQMTNGLKALHEKKILHRDLKSANVFLFKNNQAKLGDLNVSKINKKGLLYTQTGTPYYASPEVWKNKPYDHKSDIWSLGCVIYEMTALKPPFRGNSMEQVYNKVIRGNYDQIPTMYSHSLSMMISSLLQVNPNLRPSCDQIMNTIINKKKINNLEKRKTHLSDSNILLQTIKMPRNLIEINQNLPKSTYKKRNNDDEFKQKSYDGQNINKIIEFSFIHNTEVLNTDVNMNKKPSNEKLNHSDIANIKEKNKVLKTEISVKERIISEKENKEKHIYNMKNHQNINNYHYKKGYIEGPVMNCNNINTHNNIIIQNNIQNVIKSPYDIPKCDNITPTIPLSPIIHDIKYKPLIIHDLKSIKNNLTPKASSPKRVLNTSEAKPKFRLNRPITASRNNDSISMKNLPNASYDINHVQRNNILPTLNKDNSLVSNQNFSIIQIKDNIVPVHRIYSSNNHKRNRDNIFRNDNSYNPPYYSNNNLNNLSNLVANENYGNPLNIIPINLVKNRKMLFENCVKNQENFQNPPNKISEKINKIELINRKNPVVIPKIVLNPVKKVSPNHNNNIAWKI